LPVGPLRLEFTATTENGQGVTAEKHITVDRSQYASIPVVVYLDEGAGAPIEAVPLKGIPVQAETRLYEWRGRRFGTVTDAGGLAELRVEALSQRDTHYLISVPPTLIDNVLYQSAEIVDIILPPGVVQTEPVAIEIRVEQGSINGSISSTAGQSGLGYEVLAIALPNGSIYREPLQEDNTFFFTGLPLGEYMVALDAGEGAVKGFKTQPVIVDLIQSSATDISLSVEPSTETTYHGRLVDELGMAIPFAWLHGDGSTQVAQVSPLDGSFEIAGNDDGATSVNITSPGFWSQSVDLGEMAGGSTEVTLKQRSDLQVIAWGDGQIVVPEVSVVNDNDGSLSLVRGWIWGRNLSPELFSLNMEGASLDLETGEFALEYAPGEASWLYVTGGRATFTTREGSEVEIEAGQMMAFGDGVPTPSPVTAVATIVDLLRDGRKPTTALLYEEEPSTTQKVEDTFSSALRNISQAIVAITYILMFAMVLGALVYGVRRWIQARS
jgi:hypothetical protein